MILLRHKKEGFEDWEIVKFWEPNLFDEAVTSGFMGQLSFLPSLLPFYHPSLPS